MITLFFAIMYYSADNGLFIALYCLCMACPRMQQIIMSRSLGTDANLSCSPHIWCGCITSGMHRLGCVRAFDILPSALCYNTGCTVLWASLSFLYVQMVLGGREVSVCVWGGGE